MFPYKQVLWSFSDNTQNDILKIANLKKSGEWTKVPSIPIGFGAPTQKYKEFPMKMRRTQFVNNWVQIRGVAFKKVLR